MAFIVLPIHLFEPEIFVEAIKSIQTEIKTFYLLEEPVYFGDHKIHLNFNKIKLIYHRASLQYYSDLFNTKIKFKLNSKQNTSSTAPQVEYIEYSKLSKNMSSSPGFTEIKKHNKVFMFDPVDSFLESKYKTIFKSKLQPFLETPLFLTKESELAEYHKTKKNANSYFHASFYNWQRERLNILANSKTYDTENRNMMPLDTKVPPLPTNDSTNSKTRQYIQNAISYIEGEFPNNLEPIYKQNKIKDITPESILFPITHETTHKWVISFCEKRLSQFGKYEDAIDSVPRNILFHSAITPMLNIGLITPSQVVEIITDYYNKHKQTIGIANYEGFIRQIIGWREYQRYIYRYTGEKMRSSNHFGNNRGLSQHWYTGTTGIKPVDDAVTLAINDGYIHHILRLMVVGNMMNLLGIHPDEVYKWFMEFSLDSYDWVMVGNVYSMAMWADGGMTMRKPYISGDGYIMKMSNYKHTASKTTSKTISKTTSKTTIKTTRKSISNTGSSEMEGKTWNEKWNVVFHSFIDRNGEKLSKTYYAGLVKAWNKKPLEERNVEMKLANEIINIITTAM